MASEVSTKVKLTAKNYVAEAQMRNHFSVLDRPLDKKGGDAGPTPIDFFLTAIGGCVSMTLRIYLERKKWDLGEINVAVFLSEKLTKNGIEKLITEKISFEKEVSENQKKELLRIAAACPVVKMIKGETKVVSSIL